MTGSLWDCLSFFIMLYFKKIDIEFRYQRKYLTVDLFGRWCDTLVVQV